MHSAAHIYVDLVRSMCAGMGDGSSLGVDEYLDLVRLQSTRLRTGGRSQLAVGRRVETKDIYICIYIIIIIIIILI